jgi:hypothetical protein
MIKDPTVLDVVNAFGWFGKNKNIKINSRFSFHSVSLVIFTFLSSSCLGQICCEKGDHNCKRKLGIMKTEF